ncbi:heparinase II/III family protein [Corynebacterium casei]|uniref:heparinase II/III family protein n=1 Tax=Corynebacterium casei TaxID=160386 RepID=UPI0026487BAA|nr:heparinase II/III family protein [Corynebacterium casei]MDN5903669.1 heparinase II/III-family protein [Corynebacterium casei]
MQPEEKVAKDFPVHLVEAAIPEWSGVEYYKANPEDQRKLMKKGLATFQSDPEGFGELVSGGRRWAKYLKEERIDDFLKAAERDEASYAQESWLNTAIWLEALESHVEFLNERISSDLKNFDNPSEIVISPLNKDGASMDVHFLESILRDWPFKKSANDSSDAKLLRNDQLRLGKQVVPLDSKHWVELCSEENRHFLVFHSLRWIDALLRDEGLRQENNRKWVMLFDRWWSFVSNEESLSRIWNPTTLVQRATALALGKHLYDQLPGTLIETHVQALRKGLAQNIDAQLRQKAIAALLLILEGYDPESLRETGLWREINAALAKVIRDGGGLFAANSDEMLAARDSWSSFLIAIDPHSEFTGELLQRISQTEFWVQAHQPDGNVVPFGSKAASATELDSFPSLRYVRSHATEGQPPTNVRFVDPNGLVTGRTGWGETERNLTEETFWSIVSGPVRSRQEHQDAGRITFSSQGVNWLIDPYNDVCAGAENHSGVYVEGSRYRTNGSADLVVQRETDLVDDYVFRIGTYMPVAWRRHVTFARTANYLVVEDHLRASNEFSACVSWMINPKAEVALYGKSAYVSVDGKMVEIQFSSGQMGDLEVESIFNSEGVLLAHRLRAPVQGKTARVITLISDVVDTAAHKVSRVALGGNEYAFKVIDKRVDEQVIVTEAGAGITTSEVDVNEGVERVAQSIASGNLSDEEVLQQRAQVHKAIRENKAQVWNSFGSAASRERAIQSLKEVAQTEQVTGVRDHGLAAALIDLASVDLKNQIKDISIVHNYNRTAIVDWSGDHALQEFYQVPIYTSRDTASIPQFAEPKQIWSADLGELVLSSYNVEAPGDTLVVYFHGATDRTRHATPRFERLRSFATIGHGPLMFFADPTLDFDARMILSWFIGEESTNIHREMAKMISDYADKQNVKHVILVGNSGGGFTALQVSSYLDGVEVLSVNGQVDLGNYQPRIVDPARRAVYGVPADAETVSSDSRFNIIKRFQERGFNNRVMMYQNTGDDHHMKDHFQLFEDAFMEVNEQEKLFNVEKVFLGDGHVAPTADNYIKIIRGVIEDAHATGTEFRGLSGD